MKKIIRTLKANAIPMGTNTSIVLRSLRHSDRSSFGHGRLSISGFISLNVDDATVLGDCL
jgi:hypothetical protein